MIKKFESFDQSSDDFDMSRRAVLMALDELLEQYSDMMIDISPKHWRTSGSYWTQLNKFKEDLKSFTPVTVEEKENDWVKAERSKKP